VTVEDQSYVAVLEDWPLLIGRFICGFSNCEYWTYHLLEALGGHKVRTEYAKSSLARRVDKVRALAKECGLTDALAKDLSGALHELKSLSRQRNLASHNAPMMHVYIHAETDELMVVRELRAANNEELQATKENLAKWFARARALDELLWRLDREISFRPSVASP
jgi:hypothetical protein